MDDDICRMARQSRRRRRRCHRGSVLTVFGRLETLRRPILRKTRSRIRSIFRRARSSRRRRRRPLRRSSGPLVRPRPSMEPQRRPRRRPRHLHRSCLPRTTSRRRDSRPRPAATPKLLLQAAGAPRSTPPRSAVSRWPGSCGRTDICGTLTGGRAGRAYFACSPAPRDGHLGCSPEEPLGCFATRSSTIRLARTFGARR